MVSTSTKLWFKRGLRDGIPISLGYFAVAFTMGIAAKNCGFTALQATLCSLTHNASAGQFAGFTLAAAGVSLAEMALMILVTNARYLLMSCALSQKLPADTPLHLRLLVGYDVTDEIFSAAMSVPGKVNPFYILGLIAIAMPGWASGTYLGSVSWFPPRGRAGWWPAWWSSPWLSASRRCTCLCSPPSPPVPAQSC